jgi:hypothetical protein
MKTHEITLPVSGVTLHVRRQPIQVIQQISQRAESIVSERTPKPKPPVQEVVTGPSETKSIPNQNDPEYVAELNVWQSLVAVETMNQMMAVLTRVGIVHNNALNDYLDDAKDVQESYKDLGYDVPNDLMQFALQYIIAPATEDSSTLLYEVFGRTLPTESQVAFKRAMFQGNVSESIN